MLNLEKDDVSMAAAQLYAMHKYPTEVLEQKLGWELIVFKKIDGSISHFTPWKKIIQ